MTSKPKTLAGLDIETLSLENDAIVFQVGIAVSTFVPPSKYPTPTEEDQIFRPEVYSFGVNILEQMVAGRSYSKDTLDFHRKVAASTTNHSLDTVSGINAYFCQDTSFVCSEAASNIRRILSNADEVWINHPEFDLPRLFGALNITTKEPLFDFRRVRDVCMARKSGLRLPDVANGNRHRHDASLDASWNLQIALAWHHRVHYLLHLEDSLAAVQETIQDGLRNNSQVSVIGIKS
jgi:hypothetical protein